MNTSDKPADIANLKSEFYRELLSIADWWVTHTVDHAHGGFHGEVDGLNSVVSGANKGIILNARILWFFSEVALTTTDEINNDLYHDCATRAYQYILQHFLDKVYGGVYWEVDVSGKPINTRKQVYAQAFTIYALSAYFKLARSREVLDHALRIFKLLESKAVDQLNEGYLEAFASDWSPIEDMRLSPRDLNYPKSQNTHLHVLEAYTALHDVQPVAAVKSALRYNLQLFDRFMINRDNHHLRMFMDMQWRDHSPGFTYGHDIEAVWLIGKALASLGDTQYTSILMPTLLKVAEVTAKEALADNGQLWNAYDFATKCIDKSSMWWVQAEALVGFLFAYTETKEAQFFSAAKNVWQFIKQHQIDRVNGEWFWLADNALTNGQAHLVEVPLS